MTAATLAERIAAIRFYDIVKLAKAANGGRALGIDVNREFAGGGSKAKFAQWCVAKFDAATLESMLPEYEETARAYYNRAPVTRNNRPRLPNSSPVSSGPAAMASAVQAPPVDNAPANERRPVITPQSDAVPAAANDAAGDLAVVLARLMAGAQAQVNPQQVADICKAEIDQALARIGALPTRVELVQPDGTARVLAGMHHKTFADLLRCCNTKDPVTGQVFPVWLPGPAGSGKTTAAQNVAKELGMDFYAFGSVKNKYELLGFRDATGDYKPTTFRLAYEFGGVCLADEIDDSSADALPCINSAIENGFCSFPDGVIQMHKDFILIAAANTYGSGATHEYVGRNKLDAATVDRFTMLDWGYDEALELAMGRNDAWTRKVQAIRRAVAAAGIKHVVSPRASKRGGEYLAQGFSEAQVLNMCVFKGLSAEQRSVIMHNVR